MVGKVFEKPFKMTNSVLLRKSAFGSFTVNFGMCVCDDIDPTLALIAFFFLFSDFLSFLVQHTFLLVYRSMRFLN